MKENKEWFWVLWNYYYYYYYYYYFAWNLQNQITIWHWTCHGTMLYDPKLIIIWAFEMEHKMLSSTHFNFQWNMVHLLDPHTFGHAMLVYVPNNKTNQKKKKSFLLCLVWGLRHTNMHKLILFVVKRTSSNFKYSFWIKHGWCWDEFHPYWKCMCWWKMKY